MFKFHSAFAPLIHDFIKYRVASNMWNMPYEINLSLFDRYCAKNYTGTMELTEEMVISWCRKRDSETNNSCRARIFVALQHEHLAGR